MSYPASFGVVVGQGPDAELIESLQRVDGKPEKICRYTHAFIVIENNQIVEAEPHGACISSLDKYNPQEVYYPQFILSNQQVTNIISAAHSLVGTPYSFMDYASLAALRFHIRPDWVTEFVADTGHMICSQLADECFKRAGIHLFADNRFPGDVTPADLATIKLVDGPNKKIEYNG